MPQMHLPQSAPTGQEQSRAELLPQISPVLRRLLQIHVTVAPPLQHQAFLVTKISIELSTEQKDPPKYLYLIAYELDGFKDHGGKDHGGLKILRLLHMGI